MVIEHVLFNGEIEDIELLFKLCSSEKIEQVVKKYEKECKREKRTNYIRMMYLN